MKKYILKKSGLLFLLLFFIITSSACVAKDKKTVISNDVSKEVKDESIEIQRNIEMGDKFLNEGNFEEAKKAYEKAISLNIGNKNTYLHVKDKYMAKGRIDDAFYVIKLAVKNNVDTANMKEILEEIKKKFEVAQIAKTVNQGDKYILPKKAMFNINNEEREIPVKWDNPKVDTSNPGAFVFKGIAEQYDRQIQLTLNVKQNVKKDVYEKKMFFIKQVYEENGIKYLDADDVEFYRGADAKREREKDGINREGEYYIRNNNKVIKSYKISEGLEFNLCACMIVETEAETHLVPVNYNTFKNIMNEDIEDINNYHGEGEYGNYSRRNLCWIEFKNGEVIKIESQYTP